MNRRVALSADADGDSVLMWQYGVILLSQIPFSPLRDRRGSSAFPIRSELDHGGCLGEYVCV